MTSTNKKHVSDIVTYSPEQTYMLGKEASKFVYGGLCIMLNGDLGSGKTTFVKGLVRGLEGDEAKSPSFNLVNEYAGRINVAHADLYRLKVTDGYDLGLYDYLNYGYLLVVEWCDRWTSPPSSDLWYLSFGLFDVDEDSFPDLGNKRKIAFTCLGDKACKSLAMYLESIETGGTKKCLC